MSTARFTTPKHGGHFPSLTRPLRRPHPNMQILYSPTVAITHFQSLSMNNSEGRRLNVQQLLKATSPNVLNWKVQTHTSHKTLPLATQRNRLRRQWTGAVLEALRKRGVGADGTVLGDGRGGPTGSGNGLSGTMELVIHSGHGFGEGQAVFTRDADAVVDILLKARDGKQETRMRR